MTKRASEIVKYQCAYCSKVLLVPDEGKGSMECQHCGFMYEYANEFLSYNCDAILHERFRKKFLLNKALNNNGFVSYHLLKEGSLSLPDRGDVQRFRDFIASSVSAGKILDIGCGVLPLPGYLEFANKDHFEIVGLDPIYDRSFQGLRVVGCSEFTPFPSGSFDALVFATSLDHVCCLDQTLEEAYRILGRDGRVCVWMSDRSRTIIERLAEILDDWRKWKDRRTNRRGYRDGRFVVFPNYTVLYVPKGAVDPFHSYFESPDYIKKRFLNHRFGLVTQIQNSKDEVFLSFKKL